MLPPVVVVHLGPAQAVFDTVALTAGDWLLATAIASSTLLLEEARKLLLALLARAGVNAADRDAAPQDRR